MSEAKLMRVLAENASEICEVIQPEGRAAELLEDELAPRAYLDALMEAGEFQQAIRFLAHALPARETIWWSLCCARAAAGDPGEVIQCALDATHAWVMDPSDEHRRAAMEAAEKAGYDTPAGCTALAVFLSGGSLAPPDSPEVPPDAHLAARTASGALLLSTVTVPQNAMEAARAAVDLGIEISNSPCPWES